MWSVQRTERERECVVCQSSLNCWSVRRTERERVCVFYVKFMDEFIEGLQIAGILLVCLI